MALTVRQLEVLFNSLSKLSDAADKASERTIELQARFAGMEKNDANYDKVKKQLAQSQKKEKELKVDTNKLTRQQNQLVGENTQAFKTLVENTREFNVEAIKLKGEYSSMGKTIEINRGQFNEVSNMVGTFTAQAEKASNRLEEGFSDKTSGPAAKARTEGRLAAAEVGKDASENLLKVVKANQDNISKIGTDSFEKMDSADFEQQRKTINTLRERGVDISKDQVKEMLKILDTQEKEYEAQEKSNKAINGAMKLTQKVADGIADVAAQVPLIGGMLSGFVTDSFNDFSKILRERLRNQLLQSVAFTKAMGQGFKGIIPAVRAFGGALATATGGITLALGLMAALAVAALAAFTAVRDTASELGVSLKASFQLQGTLAKSRLQLIGTGQDASSISGELIEAFGTLEKVTTGNIVQIGKLATKLGASTSDIISIQKQLMDMTGASADSSAELISNIGRLATAEGVGAGNVIADIASNMATFAEFSTMGAQGLAEAAVQAAKVGSSLSNVNAFAEKLIDFETSITNEFEAQVLTGKNLNLEKARELALQGKMGELSQELQAQVGGLGDLQSMNVVEKRAISAAIGVSVADLQKISRGEAIEQKKTQEDLLSELIEVNKKGFKGNEAAFGKGDTSFNNFMNYGD